MSKRIVHVIGTGTIGEPLIGLLTSFQDKLGIDEVTFNKRTPLLIDRSKVTNLLKRGARLATSKDKMDEFKKIGIEATYETEEAIDRASVVIDCTPSKVGLANKKQYYEKYLHNTAGFIAQGSEFGFGKPYARGINDKTLIPGSDQFIQVVSCNTHNLAVLLQSIAFQNDNFDNLVDGHFLCIRRSSDISQDDSFVPSPVVDRHKDEEFGTHHARDAFHLYKTLDVKPNIYSSALKLNTQYMHTIWFAIKVDEKLDVDEVIKRLKNNDRVAISHKRSANSVFSFGRDYGHYGRILNVTVVPLAGLAVRGGTEVLGFCFTPQDGNSLLSSVAATTWFLYPDEYEKRIQCLKPFFFDEV